MKNWKSTLAFFIFIGVYVYVVVQKFDADIVEVAGYVSLYSSLFMMLRSELTTDLIGKLIDRISIERK